jgi:hypothetical protein
VQRKYVRRIRPQESKESEEKISFIITPRSLEESHSNGLSRTENENFLYFISEAPKPILCSYFSFESSSTNDVSPDPAGGRDKARMGRLLFRNLLLSLSQQKDFLKDIWYSSPYVVSGYDQALSHPRTTKPRRALVHNQKASTGPRPQPKASTGSSLSV